MVNAKPGESVVVRFDVFFGSANVRIVNCRGDQDSTETQDLVAGARAWKVPPSGLLETRRDTPAR